MVQPQDIAQAFLNHTPIKGVQFEHNDYVCIVAGSHAGQFGSLITVIGLEPEPKFVLELESGFDIEIMQSQIKYIDS